MEDPLDRFEQEEERRIEGDDRLPLRRIVLVALTPWALLIGAMTLWKNW